MADTRKIRAQKGPVTYLLRFFVIAYLFALVIWPLSEVVKLTFAPIEPGAAGGVAAFWERLQDPAVAYAFQLTLTLAIWAVIINTVFGVGSVGFWSIVVSGALVSTVHLYCAGVGSTFFAGSIARTSKV